MKISTKNIKSSTVIWKKKTELIVFVHILLFDFVRDWNYYDGYKLNYYYYCYQIIIFIEYFLKRSDTEKEEEEKYENVTKTKTQTE